MEETLATTLACGVISESKWVAWSGISVHVEMRYRVLVEMGWFELKPNCLLHAPVSDPAAPLSSSHAMWRIIDGGNVKKLGFLAQYVDTKIARKDSFVLGDEEG